MVWKNSIKFSDQWLLQFLSFILQITFNNNTGVSQFDILRYFHQKSTEVKCSEYSTLPLYAIQLWLRCDISKKMVRGFIFLETKLPFQQITKKSPAKLTIKTWSIFGTPVFFFFFLKLCFSKNNLYTFRFHYIIDTSWH